MGSEESRSTQALVADTIAGDHEAFALLVDRYRDAASAVAYSYLGGFDDAQDAVQEAFVQAYCNLRQLREPAHFGPWLRKITVNACIMALRKRERSNVSIEEICEQASSSDDARKIVAREVVREALSKLSDVTRLTVTLCYINGYSHAEIAEFMEMPITAVRSRLRHAKRKLREEMIEMVEEVLHEDKPGEELARKILTAKRVQRTMVLDNNEEALQYCNESLNAIQELGSSSRAPEEIRELLIRMVESQDDFPGDKNEALQNLRTWPVKEIMVREQAELLLRKGEIMLRLDDVEEARKFFARAEQLIEGINNKEASAKVIASIAHAFSRYRHTALAREYLPRAIENAKALDNTYAEAIHTWTLAATYLDDAEPMLAKPLLERAGALYAEANQPGYAVVAQATLDLIDEVKEHKWSEMEQWISGCLALKKSGDCIETTDKGLIWGSKPGEWDWKPEVGVLYRIDSFNKMFDAALPAGSSWSGGSNWFVDAYLDITTTIISYEKSVETTLSRFQGCMLLEIVVHDTLKGDETEEIKQRVKRMCGKRHAWFAPGIGLVRFATQSENGYISIVDLKEYDITEPSGDYLPLTIGNSWTYGWVDSPEERASEWYRVAANEGDYWYIENYRYVFK